MPTFKIQKPPFYARLVRDQQQVPEVVEELTLATRSLKTGIYSRQHCAIVEPVYREARADLSKRVPGLLW